MKFVHPMILTACLLLVNLTEPDPPPIMVVVIVALFRYWKYLPGKRLCDWQPTFSLDEPRINLSI
jgi:hypothetical protein